MSFAIISLIESVLDMKDIYGISREKLIDWLDKHNVKSYKAIQIFEWLYEKRVKSFDEMTNLKKDLIDELKKDFYFGSIKIKVKQTSDDTNKYLFELNDGNLIEAVLMKHDYGLSVCVSSEIGCNMGCAFCESGRLKKVRNLESGEMVEEIIAIEDDIKEKINSVVIMGIGEPFDNYDNVIDFIKIINDAKGLKIGARHITVSTSGIIPKIKEFEHLPLQVNLAVSLHAPNDKLRSKIMPINKAYPISDLMDALKEYIEVTNRRVTIEYVLLKDVNDTDECALELANLLKGMNVYVNLIPYNETSHIDFKTTNDKQKMRFYDILKKHGITVTVRRKYGGAIDAACGQLRANEVVK